MPPPLEPQVTDFSHLFSRYFFATRPAFLSVSVIASALGSGVVVHSGQTLNWPLALLSLLLALLAQAGINVINDYCDWENGGDACNNARLFPFTGGSRFIQNGVLTPHQTHRFALILFGLVAIGGLSVLFLTHRWELISLGFIAVVLGWGYSAPPLRLNSRGWGEISVAVGFMLMVIGTTVVQQPTTLNLASRVALSYGLLLATLLYVNQFPDRQADAQVGKHHWVVRLSLPRAVLGYLLLVLFAYTSLLVQIGWGELPRACALALLTAIPHGLAWLILRQHAANPAALRPALVLNIVGVNVHGLLLLGGLLLS